MNDILPSDIENWHRLEDCADAVMNSYGFQEIRTPVLEHLSLFDKGLGETSDVVTREMYAFLDRGGEMLALRPEGTAGTVRAAIDGGLLHGHSAKLWYRGAMFRRERPQRGRSRQFHQIGVELFGLNGPEADLELILLSARLWSMLGLDDLTLEINSLGSNEARAAYRNQLRDFYGQHHDQLDEDSKHRLDRNPLRILDSKNPAMIELNRNAPSILDHLDKESQQNFEQLREMLDACGQSYVVNPHLVRGLDYYNQTVFEWITANLGAQATVCAGGRYDSLVEIQGGKPCPAVGFAMGQERLVELMKEQTSQKTVTAADIFLVAVGENTQIAAMVLAEKIRTAMPDIAVECNLGAGSFKAQFKRANRSGALFALVIGEQELEEGKVGVKPMRDQDLAQCSLPEAEIVGYLEKNLE